MKWPAIKTRIQLLLDKLTPSAAKIAQDKKNLILAGLVIVIFLYVDFSFILGGQRRAIRAVNAKITGLRAGLQNLEADLKLVEQQQAGLRVGPEKELIAADQIPWVIDEISRLAADKGVRIHQIRPLLPRALPERGTARRPAPLADEEKTPALINLELYCGFHQLARFLAALENHSIFLEVAELEISRSDKPMPEQAINLLLRTYVDK